MNKIVNKTINIFIHPSYILLYMDKKGIIRLNDQKYLELMYKKRTGKILNLKDPQSFNEKLQWLKLYDHKDIYSTMVDKYEVKNYISKTIGEKYVIPTLGIYDDFDSIDFSKLPNQFVIKCTHDSGGLVIVNDKNILDLQKARSKINDSLKNKYFYSGREWAYKNVKPRIIVEKYMIDQKLNELRDYKFFCFNGKVKFFKIDFNRYTKHQANYYDIDGNLLKFGEKICPPDFSKKLQLPNHLKEMIELAEKLSSNIPFIRVDFYEINNDVFFGELTFYPANGFGNFLPDEWDLKLGKYIVLPKRSD